MTSATGISFGFAPGDVVIVTGAGSGIGRATSIHAAELGLAVAAWDLNGDTVKQTVATIEAAGGKGFACTADVGDDGQVHSALASTAAALGEARYLVNNAGPASASTIEFEKALALCIGSVRRVTESWLARGTHDGAALVNVASVAGNVIGTQPDWYGAAKAGIMGYTRHLAAYRTAEVRSNAVAPGMTDTPRLVGFTASDVGQRALARMPMHRLASPDEIAWAILYLLSPLASYIHGVLLPVDGGWTITQ
jgi:NAD(P)-dependent dehydrogenase (short-subunit alcohol dehydrogenase family)